LAEYIEEARELARKNGGECLSLTCPKTKTKLEWKCKEGHEWSGLFSNVKHYNNWCDECADLDVRLKNIKEQNMDFKNNTKLCMECHIIKSFDNFYYKKDISLYSRECKLCISIKNKEQYAKNSDSKKKKCA